MAFSIHFRSIRRLIIGFAKRLPLSAKRSPFREKDLSFHEKDFYFLNEERLVDCFKWMEGRNWKFDVLRYLLIDLASEAILFSFIIKYFFQYRENYKSLCWKSQLHKITNV